LEIETDGHEASRHVARVPLPSGWWVRPLGDVGLYGGSLDVLDIEPEAMTTTNLLFHICIGASGFALFLWAIIDAHQFLAK
jgi:hypothetical protein